MNTQQKKHNFDELTHTSVNRRNIVYTKTYNSYVDG